MAADARAEAAGIPREPEAAPTPPGVVPRRWAALAGLLSAAVALATVELLAGLVPAVPSLIFTIGDTVIRSAPGSLERWAIGLLGTADKPVLVGGVTVVSLSAGALLGVVASKRFAAGAVGFVAFGVAGVLAASFDVDSNVVAAILAVGVALTAGIGLLQRLLSMLRGWEPSAGVPADPQRRAFLRVAGIAGLAAAGAVGTGRWLSNQAVVAAARMKAALPSPRSAVTVPSGADLKLAGLTPYVMPNDRFYRIDTALRVPQVDPETWMLRIVGKVERPYSLTYDQLLELATVEEAVTLSCVSNEVGDDLVGNAVWQGVPLRDVLERAGVQPGGTQIVGRSVDGFTAGFPTEIGMTVPGALVAVGMNGVPLPTDHGFPARLVVPGLYGYVSATKWLSHIELTGFDDFDGYWIPRGWAKEGPIKTQSRIDVPRSRQEVAAGPQKVAGIAWAPARGIEAVQVRVDGGTWHDATLAEVVGPNTWRQWFWDWDAEPGEHHLAVRAADGDGEFQSELTAPPFPDGASGYHIVTVRVV